ncbi:myosin heavy chain, non-muscle-like [Mya arenaria]|uniref:myosin heavy chain, non-muscle-like n=1 Tax=Mya arenaria TaxID=6604 RepID=UPI0022E1F9DA|nr:myosin heavy chain, non-muscle-like [Mya arenaria]
MNDLMEEMDLDSMFPQGMLEKCPSKSTRSSVALYSNHDTLLIIDTLKDQKKQREQEEIYSQLADINKRVHQALEKVGLEGDKNIDEDDDDDVTMATGSVKLPPIYDTPTDRVTMMEQDYIIERLDSFEEKAVLRKQYLKEVNSWFQNNLEMASDVVTSDEMNAMIKEAQELNKRIRSCFRTMVAKGDMVVKKGRELLEETSKIIEERRAQMQKKTRREKIIVYDDKILLEDPIKWESSANTIISVFEDSHKMIKNVMFKNALKLGQKQFEYLMTASDKRSKELDDKKKQCMELQGKLHHAKILADRQAREIADQKRHMTKLKQEIADTNKALEEALEKNRQIKLKVVGLNSKILFLEGQIKEMNQIPTTPPPPPTPPTPPEPEIVYVKVVDSSIELQLHEVQEELNTAKGQIEENLNRIKDLEQQLASEQDRRQQLDSRLLELETTPVTLPPTNTPTESPVPEERDSSYYKTLMAGMKSEFEMEMGKVKSYIKREKNRGEATIRKMELLQKDQYVSIQRDTMRMLRAIMHFRDHMLTCMEKEDLIDQAQTLYDLRDITDVKPTSDTRELLTTVASSVVEYLNNIEAILSSAFLALKIFMKYQIDKQVEYEVQQRMIKERKEMQNKLAVQEVQRRDSIVKSKEKDVSGLAKKLKKANQKIKKTRMDINTFNPDPKYQSLLLRYQNMMKMYLKTQSEMETLQNDFHDTMKNKKKLDEKDHLIIAKIHMEMKQNCVIPAEELKTSAVDKRENLRRLKFAYDENKISHNLYQMSCAIIRKTMEIPQQKLHCFFEQYIAYRAVQDTKEHVLHILSEDEDLAADTREEMKQYMTMLDGRLNRIMRDWRSKMTSLEMEQVEMNKKIYRLFNEVLLETGLLLVHPHLKGRTRRNLATKAATQVTRNQMKELLIKRRSQTMRTLLELPSEIQGSAVPLQSPTEKFWQTSKVESELAPSIESPHMLAYEINKPRICATRGLRARRQIFKIGRTESFHIDANNYLDLIRNTNKPRYYGKWHLLQPSNSDHAHSHLPGNGNHENGHLQTSGHHDSAHVQISA